MSGDISVCFIHSCNLPMWGTSILESMLQKIKDSGLYDDLKYLFINNIGLPLAPMPAFDKAIITNYSTQTDLFENCTLRQMVFFAQFNPGVKILYLHTKGVSHDPASRYTPGIRGWVEYLMYSLVQQHVACRRLLDFVNVAGCNFRHGVFDKNGSHFSGNFWWVQSDYLKSMPVYQLQEKYDAEFWLFKNNPTFIHIHNCPYGHYERYYPKSEYEATVAADLEYIISILPNIGSIPIQYGVDDNYIDVTELSHHQGRIWIPAGDQQRNALYGDPVPGVVKHIRIGNKKYTFFESVHLPITTA